MSPLLLQAESGGATHCLTFWYAAFGVGDTAELRVIKADNSSGELVLDKVRRGWGGTWLWLFSLPSNSQPPESNSLPLS